MNLEADVIGHLFFRFDQDFCISRDQLFEPFMTFRGKKAFLDFGIEKHFANDMMPFADKPAGGARRHSERTKWIHPGDYAATAAKALEIPSAFLVVILRAFDAKVVMILMPFVMPQQFIRTIDLFLEIGPFA